MPATSSSTKISFNSVVGMICMTAALVCFGLGLYVDESYLVYAGYASAISGFAMLLNTIIFRPYIGKLLGPFIFIGMIIMGIGGLTLIFPPLAEFIKQYINEYHTKLFYTYLMIYGLAILHLVTGM